MPLRKIVCLVCVASGGIFLGLGYAAVNPWMALGVALTVFSFWGFALWRLSTRWILLALLVSLAAAVLGLTAGAVPLDIFFGVSFALADWDLVLLDQSLAGQEPSPAGALLASKHIQSLGLSMGIGGLIYLGGRILHLPVSFGVFLLLAILILFGVDRLWRMLAPW
jgi:hypothetical protein